MNRWTLPGVIGPVCAHCRGDRGVVVAEFDGRTLYTTERIGYPPDAQKAAEDWIVVQGGMVQS